MGLYSNANNSYLDNLKMGCLDITPMAFLLLNGLTDLYWVDASDPNGDFLFNEKEERIVEIVQSGDGYIFFLEPANEGMFSYHHLKRFEDIELLINYLNK